MSEPMFVLEPKRRGGRPRAEDPRVRLSTRVPESERATLERMALARGTSLSRLTGDILGRVAAKVGRRPE